MNDFSIYPGIVIQNNDPDKSGKVKVFVAGITNTIYDGWNSISSDKIFDNISGDLLPIMKTLKEDLPWAECATGLFGGDSSQLNNKESLVSLQRASSSMEMENGEPKDAFKNKKYTPGKYSGTSAGFYSIPSVGSHVYVFFKRGDTNYPVYIGATHGADEWISVLKDNYPNDYENSNTSESIYENKHVLNTSKHTLEFIDSDGKEEIKLSHYSGSNIQMLNDYTSVFTVGDNYSLTNGNHIYTIGGDLKGIIGGECEETFKKSVTTNIKGSCSVTVGDGQVIDVTGDVTIKATGAITIESAGGKIVLDASGVSITGTTINLN